MRLLFGDDLPADVVRRTTKANFTLAYFRGATRAFARRWDGRGLDEELVDPERLRDALLSPVVDPRAALALQAAWVDSVARGREQLLADRV
jgi:asparagine synthase (glutamine-hydrolysing)